MKCNPGYSLYRAFVVKSLIYGFKTTTPQLPLSATERLKQDTPEYILPVGRADSGKNLY
jgi:hypothetical protein